MLLLKKALSMVINTATGIPTTREGAYHNISHHYVSGLCGWIPILS